MKTPELRLIEAPTLVREQALTRLREAIIEGYFAPGERLVEYHLCELLGVSRPLIREVLRHLESEGLIVAEPRSGYKVAKISAIEAEEIYETRALLEGPAMQKAGEHATEKDIARLRRIFDKAARAAGKKDLPRLATHVSEFHSLVFEIAGNRVLADILLGLHARISLLRVRLISDAARLESGIGEIRAIIDAIESRDPERVLGAALYHVRQAAALALESIRKEEDAESAARDRA